MLAGRKSESVDQCSNTSLWLAVSHGGDSTVLVEVVGREAMEQMMKENEYEVPLQQLLYFKKKEAGSAVLLLYGTRRNFFFKEAWTQTVELL